MVNRDEDGRMDKGVLFVRIEVSEGKIKASGERYETDGMSVRVRSRCVRLENSRGGWVATDFKGFERRERLLKGIEVRQERESRLWKAFELRLRILSRGAGSGAVMVLMLLEEADRDVKDGNELVNFTI